jgi:predicted NUDIX family NTP pyrophosphohydrolase
MPKTSAGLMLFRNRPGGVEVLLVHPGGPFFKNKDDGAWSIPKGEVGADEDPLACAKREFQEEIGFAPDGDFVALRPIKQKGGKVVRAWAVEGDCEPAAMRSNTFTMEWPPRSGRTAEFPEIDRAEFFAAETAKQKINAAQAALVDELVELLRK